MNVKSFGSYSKILLPLTVTLVLMGCASGTTKTEAWTFDQEVIHNVRSNCRSTFVESDGSTMAALWANKRAILQQSRNCTQAANILADQAENRNKVIGQ